jgi:hypothetical protein
MNGNPQPDMKHPALDAFRRPPLQHNCAQAVLHGYQAVSGDRTLAVEDFAGLGGGRAPEGLCGALYAATRIAPLATDALKKEFVRRTGSITCKELKGCLRQPCVVCVATAAELLEETLNTPGHEV